MYFRFSFDIFIHTYIHTYIIHFYLRHKVDTQHTYLTLFAVRRVAQTSKTDRREHFISATIRVETDLVTNCREWSTATRSGSGDSSMACSEQNRLVDTRGNGWWWWWLLEPRMCHKTIEIRFEDIILSSLSFSF